MCRERWKSFSLELDRLEKVLAAAESGAAFAFEEGTLVKALREGSWLLLDEINLAPPEVSSPSFSPGLASGESWKLNIAPCTQNASQRRSVGVEQHVTFSIHVKTGNVQSLRVCKVSCKFRVRKH